MALRPNHEPQLLPRNPYQAEPLAPMLCPHPASKCVLFKEDLAEFSLAGTAPSRDPIGSTQPQPSMALILIPTMA
jgi:hypothetical protein